MRRAAASLGCGQGPPEQACRGQALRDEGGRCVGPIETEDGFHVIKLEQIAKDAEAEKIGRQETARDLYIAHESERLAAEAAKQVLAAAAGGKSLEDALAASHGPGHHAGEIEGETSEKAGAAAPGAKAGGEPAAAKQDGNKEAGAKEGGQAEAGDARAPTRSRTHLGTGPRSRRACRCNVLRLAHRGREGQHRGRAHRLPARQAGRSAQETSWRWRTVMR